MTWKTKVYAPPEFNTAQRNKWYEVKNEVLTRDHYRCIACRSTFRLSAHHLVPRRLGGSSVPANLVTLCERCHDLVEPEAERIQTPTELQAFLATISPPPHPRPSKPHQERGEPLVQLQRDSGKRPDWHARVYGGQRG